MLPQDGSFKLVIIGDGPMRIELEADAEKNGARDSVAFLGAVEHEQVASIIRACDATVAPYPEMGDFYFSPLKLFEYMAMGKGIVASDLDQIGEVLEHDHTAWMVKPGDAESLMLGLKVLIDNPDTSKRLGEAARREVVAKYTWKEHTRKIIEKLKERCP